MAGSFESDANDNNIVKVDDSVSSDASSTDTFPSTTRLGRKPVPVISSCQGLLDAIEKYREDVPFVVELLKKSALDFTDGQSSMVQDVFEGAEIENKYGFIQQYYNALAELGESLDLRIDNEKEFFTAQKERCTKIYEILRHSSFPYSAAQGSCLHSMLLALYQITGHPDSEADKDFMTGLRELIILINRGDHLSDSTPHRFIVTNTIHYCLHGILTKADELAKEEMERLHPDFLHPHSEINLACYLANHVSSMIDKTKVLTQREHFHYGMVEIYTRFVEIFKSSGLEFSTIQDEVIREIEDRVKNLKEEPFMIKHIGIVNACREFMTELEENNPDREYKLEGDKLVLAPEGVNNRAINEISWDLVYLRPVATGHLVNFPSFGHGVEDVIAQATERFLALYPMH